MIIHTLIHMNMNMSMSINTNMDMATSIVTNMTISMVTMKDILTTLTYIVHTCMF
jgi:hypothetical protein